MSQINYWRNLFIAFDQLLNAIRGGYADTTISAVVGYYSEKTELKRWVYLARIIDWAFYPVDGPLHCLQAYQSDKFEKFIHGSSGSVALLWIITLLFIPPIALSIRIYTAVK